MAVIAGRGVSSGRSGTDLQSGATGNDVSQREDLANFISMITRDETPFMSSIGKTKATAIYHEWQTDQLASPGNSVIGEGTDFVFGNIGITTGDQANAVGDDFANQGPNRSRLGNYTQINGKTIAVSGTRRAIDQAGVADEYAYQLKKRGTELRRDLEHDLIHSFNTSGSGGSGQSTGSATTYNARTFGGYQAWINQAVGLEDPDNDGGTTLNLGGNVIYKGDFVAPTNPANGREAPQANISGPASGATKDALALSDIDEVMQSIYQNGGKAGKIMLSPKLRRDFSDLMQTETNVRRNIDMDGKLRQSVDVYMSDFGDVMVVPNYIMGLSNSVSFGNATGNTGNVEVRDFSALMYDPMWFAVATLRPLQEVDVGQRGDSTIGMMIEECTLEVKNPQGCGAIYGLN